MAVGREKTIGGKISLQMDGWLIAFIILCVVYGPIYVFGSLATLASIYAPGTDLDPIWSLAVVAGAVPLVYVGWRAFGGPKNAVA